MSCRDDGLNGPRTRALLDVIYAQPLLPFDSRQLARTALMAPLMCLWEQAFKDEAEAVVLDALNPGHNLAGVSMAQLIGTGDHAAPQNQAGL